MNNREIAAVLFNISTILADQHANPYRIRAYRRAARSLLRARHSVTERAAAGEPLGIPFLGPSLTKKITQLALEGCCDFYDDLCGDLPGAEQALMKIPGIGPKLAARVAKDLKVEESDALVRQAARRGLQQIWGIGPKRAAAILEGIAPGEAQPEAPGVVRDGNVIYAQESFWRNANERDKAA